MSDIKAQIEFLKIIEKVTEKFDEAYETRKENPEKWEAAKAAFQEQRSFWRGVNHAANPDSAVDTVTVDSVDGKAAVHEIHDEEKN